MLISQAKGGRPNSAANPLLRLINSAVGRPEEIVLNLLIFLYSLVLDVQFLGVTMRFSPAGREMPSGHEGRILGGERDDLKARRAARDRDGTGARHLDEPEGLHQGDESVELFARTGHFEDERFGRRIDDACPEDIGETERLDPRLAFAGNLDQGISRSTKGPSSVRSWTL
jgi:hypothetical protein